MSKNKLTELERTEAQALANILATNQGSVRRVAEAVGRSCPWVLGRIRRYRLEKIRNQSGTAKYGWRRNKKASI